MNFQQRYGRWALLAGASQGLGAEYAKELASRGLNLVLVARRDEFLQSLAAQLTDQYDIKVKTIALDLSASDAAEQIVQQTMELEIGLLVYNAAFSAVGPFLERSMDDHLREVHINIHAPLKLVYLLGQRMLARGYGGIVLMAPLSEFQGSTYISNHAATRAFNIVLAERLWGEWRPRGVDVLACVSGAVKTPGRFSDSMREPAQVVHEAMDALGRQPFVIPGRVNRFANFVMRHLLPRKMAIRFMGRILRDMYVKS